MVSEIRSRHNGSMPDLRTIAAPVRHEVEKIKGSRFIAHLGPVADQDAAEVFVAAVSAEFRDATHNCFAWRLQDGDAGFRYSDDGEPVGSAGRPMLDQLAGRGLERVAAVVTRYYGGTKLGKGGLARAYGGAVAAALEQAELVCQPLTQTIRLGYEYGLTAAVEAVLRAFQLTPSRAEYGAQVTQEVAVRVEEAEAFRGQLWEATAGRVEIA